MTASLQKDIDYIISIVAIMIAKMLFQTVLDLYCFYSKGSKGANKGLRVF